MATTRPSAAEDAALLASPTGQTGSAQQPETGIKDVLVLGPGVSLAFKSDSLVIKGNRTDKTLTKRQRSKICGIPIGASPSEYVVPYYNVLWAELLGNAVFVDIATVSKKNTRPLKLTFAIHDVSEAAIAPWIEKLLNRAYGGAQRRKRAKVLVNPHAGPGGAVKIWKNELASAKSSTLMNTMWLFPALAMVYRTKFSTVWVSGLMRAARCNSLLLRISCGSGNGMSCNLNGTYNPSLAALAIVKGVRTPVDLVSLSQGDNRILSFLSQSLGIIAEADLGTENMRWMGAARFDVGVVQRIFAKKTYPCEISVKVQMSSKDEIKSHYKKEHESVDYTMRKEAIASGRAESTEDDSMSCSAESGDGLPPLKYGTIRDKVPSDWETVTLENLGNFYCGNMAWMAPNANFFSAACANDGLMDLVTNDGNISALKYLDLMTSVESGHFFDKPATSYKKVVAYRITPRSKEGYISVDGERVPFEPFQAEVHQGLATVLSKNGKYEAPGPMGWEKADVAAKDTVAAAP
ncbi:diacylglycerol kinase catalytic domain-containing protein [Apiospora phragmitis]|uniref:Diacylglycerol kinase catalytic domain-containing protein n=1 Tax=Apiospora phragmitis TaxID=2905665 RepID=A0ABR1VE11_9PEZI